MVTLSDLVSPGSQQEWLEFLLSALQGIQPVVQYPAQGTNQLQGTGTIQVTGPAQAQSQVVVKITTSGDAQPVHSGGTSGAFQYSLDGGVTFNPATPVSLSSLGQQNAYAIPVVNITIVFVNGSYIGTAGSYFVAGETYAFLTNTPTFPVTNWSSVGAGNAFLEIDSQAIADLDQLVATATAGGFTQSWINPPVVNGVPTPPPDGWADLLAGNYGLKRQGALQTQGIVEMVCASTAGPYTLAPGTIYAQSNDGQMWVNANPSPVTLSSGTSPLAVLFQAVVPGSMGNGVATYVSPPVPTGNYLTTLVTPLAGVTISNPIQTSPAVLHTGSGTGTMTLSGTPTAAQTVIVTIVTAGAVGTSQFQVSFDGGNSFGVLIYTAASFVLVGTGLTLSFTGTFVAGDTYLFGTQWVTQYGRDAQTSRSLSVQCQNQWPTLSANGPTGIYETWAQKASPEVVSAFVTNDAVIPGQVDVTLIGANDGPVSTAAIAAVQAYIQVRMPLTSSVFVGTVSSFTIAVTAAYIVVRRQYSVTAPQQIAAALLAYQNSVQPQGFVVWSEVQDLIGAIPGVIEINPPGIALNGAQADIQMGPNQTPSITAPPTSSYQFV